MSTEAAVLYAKDKRNSYNSLFASQQKQRENVQKRNRRMGLGRLAGSLLAGALTAGATGGLSLLYQAAAVGAGSFVGQRLAGGTTRKLDPLEKGKFFREETDAASDEYSGAISDLKRLSGQRALSDAFSAFALGGLDKIPGLSEAGQKIKGFAAGGAEGGVRDLARGGISKASNIVGDIAKGGAEGGVRDVIRTSFNNPLTQAIDNTGVEFTGSAEQNRALAQNLGLDPNVSIVDQMKAKGLDSSFESRASMFQQGKGLANTGVDISNKAVVGVNAVTGNPESMKFTDPPKEGDFNVLRELKENAELNPFANPKPKEGDFEYIDPSVVPLPSDFLGYGQQKSPYPQDLISTAYLNPDFDQRNAGFVPVTEAGIDYEPRDVGNYFYENPRIRNRSDYRGGY